MERTKDLRPVSIVARANHNNAFVLEIVLPRRRHAPAAQPHGLVYSCRCTRPISILARRLKRTPYRVRVFSKARSCGRGFRSNSLHYAFASDTKCLGYMTVALQAFAVVGGLSSLDRLLLVQEESWGGFDRRRQTWAGKGHISQSTPRVSLILSVLLVSRRKANELSHHLQHINSNVNVENAAQHTPVCGAPCSPDSRPRSTESVVGVPRIKPRGSSPHPTTDPKHANAAEENLSQRFFQDTVSDRPAQGFRLVVQLSLGRQCLNCKCKSKYVEHTWACWVYAI